MVTLNDEPKTMAGSDFDRAFKEAQDAQRSLPIPFIVIASIIGFIVFILLPILITVVILRRRSRLRNRSMDDVRGAKLHSSRAARGTGPHAHSKRGSSSSDDMESGHENAQDADMNERTHGRSGLGGAESWWASTTHADSTHDSSSHTASHSFGGGCSSSSGSGGGSSSSD